MIKELPPYGILSRVYDDFLSEDPMGDWQGTKSDWRETYDFLRDKIKDNIWPMWDPESQNWIGNSKHRKEEATRNELILMMEHFQKTNILDQQPAYLANISSDYRKNHLWHFKIEDNVKYSPGNPRSRNFKDLDLVASIETGTNYICYNPWYNPEKFSIYFAGDQRRKIHGLFDFKKDSMRPRPYQTAALFGLNDFSHLMGAHSTHTGTHPSLISGHAIQGLLLSCMVLEFWLRNNELEKFDKNHDYIKSLAQYAVDFGDRRVFAGVHYPSDNIASWFVSLSIIPRTFRFADQILEFAKFAIQDHSLVYRLIDNEYRNNADLKSSVDLLDTVLPPSEHGIT